MSTFTSDSASLLTRLIVHELASSVSGMCQLRDRPKIAPEQEDAALSFVKTELDTGLMFANIALQRGNSVAKVSRNQANARKAYDSAAHWREVLVLRDADADEVDDKFRRLRSVLEQLGETVPKPPQQQRRRSL